MNKVFRYALGLGLAPKHLLKIPRKKEKLTRLSTYDYEKKKLSTNNVRLLVSMTLGIL